MNKILWEGMFEEEKIKVGIQDFERGILPVWSNDELHECDMYQDEDGDIYFEYKGCDVYISDLKYDIIKKRG